MSSKADKRKEKKEGAGRAPEGTGDKNPASTEATPVSDFHGPDYGLSVHATRADLNDLLARGREHDELT
jgi:hypothetical protein